MTKGQADVGRKFRITRRTNLGVSGNCHRERHLDCYNMNCTCECHLGIAEKMRRAGLRTMPKPGEPGYVEAK